MNFVFVYGSLKKGFHNHSVLESSTFIGIATTNEKYDMFSYGSFPAVVEEGNYYIKGEIYYVDDETLKELDILEGNGVFYTRKLINTGAMKEVWCYFLAGHQPKHDNQEGMQIVNGDTKVWTKKF